MSERPDQDAAGVVAISLGPLPQQRSKVPSVAGDEDAGLLGGQLEHLRVIQRTQRGVGGEAQHVVAALLEGTADAFGRQVGVEDETQSSGFHDVDEREQHPQFVHRPAVVGYEVVDLIGIGVAVGDGEPRRRQ